MNECILVLVRPCRTPKKHLVDEFRRDRKVLRVDDIDSFRYFADLLLPCGGSLAFEAVFFNWFLPFFIAFVVFVFVFFIYYCFYLFTTRS